MSKNTVSFLGIGQMGSALVHVLLKAGQPVTIWNRTPGRPLVASAVSAGAVLAPTVAAAVASSEVIVAILLDHAAVHAAFASLPANALAGKTLINITSSTPKESREMHDALRARGVARYVDGAIMVPPPMVGTPHSLFLISGENETFVTDVIAPILAPAGKTVYKGTEISLAARHDIAVLAAMWGMLGGGYLAAALLKKGNSADGKVGPDMKESIVPMLAALVPLVTQEAEFWDAGKLDDHGGSPVGMQLQGLRMIIRAAGDEGIDAGVLEHLAGVHARIVKDHGSDTGSAWASEYLMK